MKYATSVALALIFAAGLSATGLSATGLSAESKTERALRAEITSRDATIAELRARPHPFAFGLRFSFRIPR